MLKFIAKEASEFCAKYRERENKRKSDERGEEREKSFLSMMMRQFSTPTKTGAEP